MRARVSVLLPLCCALAVLGATQLRGDGFVPDWSRLDLWPFPLSAPDIVNPVLTADDVGFSSRMVADPFLFHADDLWYMFFESYAEAGEIGLACSRDGVRWTVDSIVLDLSYHISYPCVFQDGDDYYMVVEAGAAHCVPLYKATCFPREWTQIGTLATGRTFADPTVFRYDGTWWLFVSRPANDVCYLYYADELTGTWTEHPQSPVVTGRWRSRPAGRPIALSRHRLIRLGQDCDPTYGEGVRAFAVDVLTRTAYAEHELPDSPILFRSGHGWNANGMHTCDLWWHDDGWIAAVDGLNTDGRWSIGIYWGQRESDSVEPVEPDGPPPAWCVVPNPSRTGQPVRLSATAAGLDRCELVEVFDAGGRLLRRLSLDEAAEPAFVPLGDDSSGPTSGVCWLRLSRAGQVRRSVRHVVLR